MTGVVPKRRSLAEAAISVALLLIGIAILVGARALAGHQNYAQVGPEVMPIGVGIGLALIGAGLLREVLTGGFRNAEPDEPSARGDHAFRADAFLWVLAGLGAQMVLMQHGGFVIAAGALFTGVARGFGSRRWLRDLGFGLLIGLVIFLFFVHFLNVNLPAGILLPILGTAGL